MNPNEGERSRPRRKRLTVGRLMVLVALVGTPLGLVVVPAARWMVGQSRFRREFYQLESRIDALGANPPKGCDATAWQQACGWGRNYAGNIVSFDKRIPPARLRAISDELGSRIGTGNVDVKTCPWMLRRIAALTPYGRRYDSRFRIQSLRPLLVGQYQHHVPPGVNPEVWQAAVAETFSACEAVYYEADFARREESKTAVGLRLLDELETKLDGPFTVGGLAAVWDMLSATGEEGRAYVETHRPHMLDSPIRKRRSPSPP